MQDFLISLVWAVAVLLVVAAAGWLILKWAAIRIARRVGAAAERRIAAGIEKGLSRTGVRIEGVADEALRAKYIADIDRIAWLMDRVIPLPVFGGIGLDAVLGLVPVAGDAISFAISSFLVIRAAQLGVPESLISRLVAIQVTDLLLGAVPFAGDFFDVAYRADQKSADLIRKWLGLRDAALGAVRRHNR